VTVLLGSLLGLGGCSAARPDPVPGRLPYIGVDLPPSAHAYQAHQQGGGHTRVLFRFEMAPDDIELLNVRLPCRFGAVEVGLPKQVLVVVSEAPWYTPERARKHRGCDHERGRERTSFLVDVTDPGRATVYGVISYDWGPDTKVAP